MRLLRGALSTHREVKVKLSDVVEATIYDRPGLWMNDDQLKALRDEVTAVAKATIPGDLAYGVFLPSRAPYENRLIVVGRRLDTGETVGFNAMPRLEVDGVTVLHLGLLVIHSAHQRKGYQGLLYGLGAFSLVHRIPESPVWVSNVTEVPAVLGAVSDYFIDVYPKPGRAPPPPPEHQALARKIMAKHRHEFGVGPDAGFDDQRFVIRGGYTGGSDALKKTFESAPKHKKSEVNDFCREQLDYGRGDDFLQIGKLDSTVITNWLSTRIPAALRPQAARQMKLWKYPANRNHD